MLWAVLLVVLLSSYAAAVPTNNGNSRSGSGGVRNDGSRNTAQRGGGNGKQNGGSGKTDNPDTSLCLSASVVQSALKDDGLRDGSAEAGQAASLTSPNNFINFCRGQTLTNGKQVKLGSCNPTPMGQIAAATKQPSCKFLYPKNLDTIPENKSFTIRMKIRNLATGSFTNPLTSYYAAPQQVNDDGFIVGHSHIAVEAIDSLTSTTLTNPQEFAFFRGLNAPAKNGILTAEVPGGLPAGTYRLASITSASNHQPVLVAVAQRGSNDDMVYFTVSNSVGKKGSQKGGNQRNGGRTGGSSNSGGQSVGSQNGPSSNGPNTRNRGSGGDLGDVGSKGSQNAGKDPKPGMATDQKANDPTGGGQSRADPAGSQSTGAGGASGRSSGSANTSTTSTSASGNRVCKHSRVKAQSMSHAQM